LFAVEAREWRTYPDSTSSALRIGDLRSGAGPEPADSVAQDAKQRKLETNDISSWLVRVAKHPMRADEPEPEIADRGCPLFYFVANHSELIL
jgi:hypothetical protein